jgi:hypothetical protein
LIVACCDGGSRLFEISALRCLEQSRRQIDSSQKNKKNDVSAGLTRKGFCNGSRVQDLSNFVALACGGCQICFGSCQIARQLSVLVA